LLFIAATKADIRIGGDRACYIPALDFITLPPETAFKSREHFLATSLHECGHWTGAKSRLDRDLKSPFNERAYAAEELIAELNAAFLCAHLGIPGELRHAEYIGHWLALLKEDDRAIFTAASKALKLQTFFGRSLAKCRRVSDLRGLFGGRFFSGRTTQASKTRT
jgi:antirestriction protein ArdC